MAAGPEAAIRPIFILSLPRTGSTLLQRILGSHDAIGTASEPWFLLPLLYSLRERGVHAEYEHVVMARGVRGFAEEYLPRGVESYLEAIHDFALRIYGEAAPGKEYFLDKTPRYHHVAEDLIRLFREGRFIFLWRNPLAVAASMMETFAAGGWNLDAYSADLFHGLSTLLDVYRANQDRAAGARYEDLVVQPLQEVERLLRYLELPLDETVVSRFGELEIRNPEYWDPTGTTRYREISGDPVERWKSTMTNPIRKAWCRRYLRWLGAERLALMGYGLDELLADVDAIPLDTRRLPSDLARGAVGFGRRWARSRVVKTPFPLWPSR